MNRLLNRLAGWKRVFLYALVNLRSASAALDTRDYRAFSRIITGSAPGFADPTRLTRWTRSFLYAHLAFVIARLCSLALDPSGTGAALDLSSAPGAAGWILRMTILYGNILLLPLWTYRANHNARQLGASGMTFTPEWAAGWYFLPPGLFWKPCLAMKEIWRASVDPENWRMQQGSPLVGWWWTLWLISAWGGLLGSGVAALVQDTATAQIVDSAVALGRPVLHLPLTLILLTIITKIHDMQMVHYRNQSQEAAT